MVIYYLKHQDREENGLNRTNTFFRHHTVYGAMTIASHFIFQEFFWQDMKAGGGSLPRAPL